MGRLKHDNESKGGNLKALSCRCWLILQGPILGEGTGVWVGIQQMEYGQAAAQHLPALGAFTATGTPFSVAAGRISFTHGFRGPAVRARACFGAASF